MAGHGGYRKPANPAAISGPGAHSRRTDGQPVMSGLGDGSYGDEGAMQQIQSGAPMAQTQGAPQGPPAPAGNPLASVVGLDAPTQLPGVPVTDGAAAGAGAGISSLGLVDPDHRDADYLSKYLPTLMKMADAPSTPPGTKEYIRNLISKLP